MRRGRRNLASARKPARAPAFLVVDQGGRIYFGATVVVGAPSVPLPVTELFEYDASTPLLSVVRPTLLFVTVTPFRTMVVDVPFDFTPKPGLLLAVESLISSLMAPPPEIISAT